MSLSERTNELLESPWLEIIPGIAGVGEEIQRLPPGSTVTVTASPRHGIEPTIDLAIVMAELGHRAVPHLAARRIIDTAHLETTISRVARAGISDLFVIAGDGDPDGDLSDSVELLSLIADRWPGQFEIGIAGYPEGHPIIDKLALDRALVEKSAHAAYVTTQMCFDPEAIAAWITRLGGMVDLPVHIGIPGATSLTKLLSVSTRIGVGQSIRFLTKHRGLARSVLKGTSVADQLLKDLDRLDIGSSTVEAVHVYTFNQVGPTIEWLRTRQHSR